MPQIEKGKSMNDDVVKKLEYWAFKLCGKGEQEDAASDVMSEALKEINKLRAALREAALMSDCCAWCRAEVADFCREALEANP